MDDFARVQNTVGIERLFYRTHDADRLAMLGDEEVHFAVTDPVFASARPLHCKGATDHALIQPVSLDQLVGPIRVEHKDEVKIAVPDMSHQGIGYGRLRKVPLGLAYAFGKARDRHAYIGRQSLGPGRNANAA